MTKISSFHAYGRAICDLMASWADGPRRQTDDDRALDTARLVCAELDLEPVVHAPLGGDFDERDAAELLAATADGGAVLLVGHEPDLSGIVAALTSARIEMKKGGIAAIRDGALLVLLRPREIELVAGL